MATVRAKLVTDVRVCQRNQVRYFTAITSDGKLAVFNVRGQRDLGFLINGQCAVFVNCDMSTTEERVFVTI